MQEIYKEIQDYEEYYQVSNTGDIYRIKYDDNGNKGKRELPYKLKPSVDKDGYLKVTLWKNRKYKRFSIHRLVAQAFIPNPNNYLVVNHLDGDKKNNNVDNLEWSSIRSNNIHALETGLRDMTKYSWKTSKVVLQYDMEMNLIAKYKSSGEAARKNNIGAEHIRHCCCGKEKSYKGYIWKHECNESSTTIENTQ